MKNKVKIIIALVIVTSMVMVGWYFLQSSRIKKVEITGNENQAAQSGEENLVSSDNLTADTQSDPTNFSVEKAPITKIDNKNNDTAKPVANNSKLKIINKLISSGFQVSDGRKIDTIIIHSSYDATGADPFNASGIIQEYQNYGVSAHYLIGRDGTIYRLVQEKDIAYHAGVSSVPDGRTGVNAFSIGIELINTKTDQMTAQQYEALKSLISDIRGRYTIKYVLGHNQIAPSRKDDPWNFEWSKLK